MPILIDLSQEIFHKAPSSPPIQVFPFTTHEERAGETDATTVSPVVNTLILCDHCSTHVDVFAHFSKARREDTVEKMPLEMFYTEAICLDLSHFPPKSLMGVKDMEEALAKHDLAVHKGDTVLLHTGHYARTFGTPAFLTDWAGIAAEVVSFFAHRGATAFGVESVGPGIFGVSNREVHQLCGELDIIHYENLVNLDQLVGKGRFHFIAFPLKIRGGTGSPVRAVAVLEE